VIIAIGIALVIIAIAAMKTASRSSLPDAVKAERFETRRAGRGGARGAILYVGLPSLVVMYALSQWFTP
jgi:hypothetical protein